MRIKYKKHISYEIERYPERCNECPAFKRQPYSCHSERGMEAVCELGYMNGKDTRDFMGSVICPDCNIEHDNRVTVINF